MECVFPTANFVVFISTVESHKASGWEEREGALKKPYFVETNDLP